MSKHTSSFIHSMHWFKAIVIATTIVCIAIIIFVLIPQPRYKDGFRTLSELQEYTTTLDEWIKMEGKNIYFPSYESYYQRNFSPSIFKTMKAKIEYVLTILHLKRKPIFSENFFKNILEDVTEYRKQKGWTGEFIQKIEVKESSKLVVFGPVQGAFHGIIRYLEKLKELGIIDENLKIQNPDYCFVFLGNVVNRSPYTLEIFSIVLRLLRNNPENVIYLKGTNEIQNTWKQHTLRRELEIRMAQFSSSKIPLENEIDAFFNTLPMTLYCTIPYIKSDKLNYFKCAAFIENEKFFKLIDAPRYATFLKNPSNNRLTAFNLENGSDNDPEANNIISRAIIRDIKKRDQYEEMDGLRLMPPTKGITTWIILSNTLESARIALKYFYDAFVIITPAKKIDDWTITLYNRDIRNIDKKDFNTRSYYFFSGKPC
jgi:hypothetical protein